MNFTQWLEYLIEPSTATEAKLTATVIVAVVLWIVRFILRRIINRRVPDVRRRYYLRKTVNYSLVTLGVLIVGRLWLEDIQGGATVLGLFAAGIAIALQGPLSNIAGWAYIMYRRPFEIGDRVEIGAVAGDVIDISLFQFSLLEIGNWVHADQSTGRIVYLPNRTIFDQPQANYSKGFDYIWNEVEVVITFESNWQKAKSILNQIATRDAASLSEGAAEHIRRAAQRFAIMYTKLTPIVYLTVIEYGVRLNIRYLCEPRRRRSTVQALWEDILTEFGKHDDIQIAYPTTRFYQRSAEFTSNPQGSDS